jgi:uncharacterized protein Usg
MKQETRSLLWVIAFILLATLFLSGFIIIFMRGTIPDNDGWSITHEEKNGYYIRIESGEVTGDFIGQNVIINTTKQYLDVYINNVPILSSQDFGIHSPIAARYNLFIEPEHIGGVLRIVLTTPDQRENMLMRNTLSFVRWNKGNVILETTIAVIAFVSGIASLVFAFALGVRKNGSLLLFAVINFSFAVNMIKHDVLGMFFTIAPRINYIISFSAFFLYALPMILFFYTATTGKWKKYALPFTILPFSYTIAAFLLNIFRVVLIALAGNGYNYVMAFCLLALAFITVLQSPETNKFAVLARMHLIVWTIWGLATVLRILVFDINVAVNVEFRLAYSFTLVSLTLFGIYVYAERVKDMQQREYIMNAKTENLMQSYGQITAHIHEVNSLKHDIKKHLTVLNLYMKDNEYDKARKYLNMYTDKVDGIIEAVYHENYLINAVTHTLLRKAETQQTKVTLQFSASPAHIAEPDIIALLTNITDNALEACAKLPPERERIIILTIKKREPYFVIVCENTNPGVTNDKLKTTKIGTGHGYGLKIIERITASYEGMTDVICNEDTFTITVAVKDG